jgi:protocatechuate 3,4-dioxygenase beta subunit
MQRGQFFFLGLSLVLVAGAALWLLDEEGDGDAPGSAGNTATLRNEHDVSPDRNLTRPSAFEPGETRQLEVAEGSDQAQDSGAGSSAGDAALLGRITGRVTWAADGRPAVGERLVARLAERTQSTEPEQALTDADGRYSFSVDQPGWLYWIEVLPGPTTPRQRHRERMELVLGADAVVDFELVAGGTLAGRVVDLEGRPVPGADVHGWTSARYQLTAERRSEPDQTVLTDASGVFLLAALGPAFVLAAEAPGMTAHTRVHGTVGESATTEGILLVISEQRVLLGQVLGPGDVPVAGASVELNAQLATGQDRLTGLHDVYAWGPPGQSVVTDGAGRFRPAPLCQRTYRVVVSHSDYPQWSGTHAPGDRDLVVRLETGLSLSGTVRSALGGFLPGAELQLARAETGRSRIRKTSADAEGRFVFRGLAPAESVYLAARADGHAVHVEQPLAILESGSAAVQVVLQPELRLAGIVTDTEGRPMDRAWVSIEGDRMVDFGNVTMSPKPTWETRFGSAGQRVDATGRFLFEGLYDGEFRVEAVSEDQTVRALVEVRAGAEELELVLDPDAVIGLTLSGVARDGTTGLAIQQMFFVTPMFPGGGGGFSGTSHSFENPEGRYRITALEPGKLLLNASTEGHAPWSAGLLEFEQGEHYFDIDFLPTRNVTFVFVDEQDDPVELGLSFEDESGNSLMVESGPSSRAGRIDTNAEGEAFAAGLPAARITVKAKKGWFGAEQEYLVDLRREPRGKIELVYGEPETRKLLVLLLTGSASEPAPQGGPPWTFARWVETQVGGGWLRPLAVVVEVSATDENGVVAARTSLDPAAPGAPGLAVEGVDAAFVVEFELPTRAFVVSADAQGYRTASRAWDPDSGPAAEVIVLILDEV